MKEVLVDITIGTAVQLFDEAADVITDTEVKVFFVCRNCPHHCRYCIVQLMVEAAEIIADTCPFDCRRR